MSEITNKQIEVICDYELKSDRIGEMERVFVPFDTQAKNRILK
jgi:hypothetical protein